MCQGLMPWRVLSDWAKILQFLQAELFYDWFRLLAPAHPGGINQHRKVLLWLGRTLSHSKNRSVCEFAVMHSCLWTPALLIEWHFDVFHFPELDGPRKFFTLELESWIVVKGFIFRFQQHTTATHCVRYVFTYIYSWLKQLKLVDAIVLRRRQRRKWKYLVCRTAGYRKERF